MSEKLYAFRHKVTTDYLLEGNGSDRVSLNTDPKYFTDFISKPDMWKHYGIWGNDGLLTNPEDMEVVEYKLRHPFFVALQLSRVYFSIDGKAEVSIVNIPVTQWDEHNECYVKDEDENPVYKNEPHVLIQLLGGSLSYCWRYPTDEGYHGEEYTVYEGIDHMAQPIWMIDCTISGRDCDGRLDRYDHLMSRGGKQNLDKLARRLVRQDREPTQEELDECKKENAVEEYCSRMWQNPHLKNTQRDYTAEAMGY